MAIPGHEVLRRSMFALFAFHLRDNNDHRPLKYSIPPNLKYV